jgi:hypothetical protein
VKEGIELEIGYKKRKIFIKVGFSPFEIWVDFHGLPQSAFLCAMCDAVPMIESKCGDKGKINRTFVNIEWVINEWGGDEEIIEAVKKRKQMILDDLPTLKQKYGIVED